MWLYYDGTAKETRLIELLQKADRSFKKVEHQRFRATNKTGFMVDLVKPEPRSVMVKERRQMAGPEALESAEVRNLQWLISSPIFTQVVIGDDGYPATIIPGRLHYINCG
ncbi:MAG: hypothetical protein HKP58_08110 [Desulfatitalea sp.]|nr:nucleotidyltransferase domain-containing protein [Desulfatitalea sp.]NNK00364.1 hypothetical protein [Desulfatitalea sp.]